MATTTSTQTKSQLNGKAERVLPIFVEGKDESSVHTTEINHDQGQAAASTSKTFKQTKQNVLLLKAVREKYTLVEDHPIPEILHKGEMLVKVMTIGLNPIDWKAPAFNFGIPALPWINGRDFAGEVVQVSDECSRVKVGDIVMVPSTDYRDIRKAAFQEYAVATYYNAARIPKTGSIHASASLGVAFVAAALALGISFGLDFSVIPGASKGPDMTKILKDEDINRIPEDVRDECFSCTSDSERVKRGDWIAIWGASTTTGYIALQLAKMCGLKVICVVDAARHGAKLIEAGADLLVDRHDTNRAVEIIRGVTGGRLRFGLDIVGKDTATLLQSALFRSEDDGPQAHLVGLTGLPKERDPRIKYHTVPIKIFHSSPALGEAMVSWLEGMLQSETLTLPEIVRAKGGLGGINDALEMLKDNSVSGKRVVVGLDEN